MHFDDLFKRYGAPVYVLNLKVSCDVGILLRSQSKPGARTNPKRVQARRAQKALTYLNQSLPEDKKILYKAFDMSRAAKTFVSPSQASHSNSHRR